MSLEERLELDIADALRGIDTLETALGSAATSFSAALTDALAVLQTGTAEIDASGITTAIDSAVAAADTSPVVTADAAGITGEIDAAVVAVDATAPVSIDGAAITQEIDAAAANADATVTVDADTSAAVSSIDDLGASATGAAGGGVESLKGGLEALGVTAALGRGEIASLAEGARGLGGGAEVAAGGVLAVGATLGEFFSKALQADTASRRFALTAGDMADAIEHVQIGGLNESLDTLTLRTGTSRVGMELANAKIVQLGQSSGASNPQIEETAKQLDAVAIHATTVNPTLGDAGAAAERLTAAFARGGRALVPFGIALSSAEINARALADTGKSTASELTIFEKAAAGVAITTERLGNKLGTDINTGAQGAEIRIRSLREEFDRAAEAFGKPLLEPVIGILHDLQPVLIEVGAEFGKLGTEVLPLVVKSFEIIGPAVGLAAAAFDLVLTILGPVIDLIDSIPTPVLAAAAAVVLLQQGLVDLALATVAETFAAIADGAVAMGAALLAAAPELAVLGLAVAGLVTVLGGGSDAEDAHAAAVDRATKAYGDNTKSVSENTAALANQSFAKSTDELNRLGLTIDQVTKLAGQGKSGYQQFLDTLAASGRITSSERDALAKSTDGIAQFIAANQILISNQGGLSESTVQLIGRFQDFARSSQDGAKAQLSLAQAHGTVTAEQVKNAEAQHRLAGGAIDYIGVLNELQPKQAAGAAGSRDAAAAVAAHAAAVDGLGRALKDVLQAEEDQIQKELGLVSASLGAESAARATEKAQQDLAKAIRDHGAASDEAKDADLRLRQAQESQTESLVRLAAQNRDTTVAQLENSGTTVDAATKSQIYRDQLIALANTVADPMRTQIIGLANDIKTIPPSSNTTINVDSAKAIGDVNATHIALDAIPDEKLISIAVQVFGAADAQRTIDQLKGDAAGSPPGLHMAGLAAGPVFPDVPVVVGEVEPEVFIPRTSGVIANQADLRSALLALADRPSQGGGSSSVTQNVVVQEVANDPQATANAVAFRLGEAARR